MKKLGCCILLLLLMFLYGCSETNVPASIVGTYELEHSEFPISAALTLFDNNEFSFVLNPLSSFSPRGTYSIEGSRLILAVDDDVAYVFSIEGDTLVFIADESWEIPSFYMSHYATVPTPSFEDGNRFVLHG